MNANFTHIVNNFEKCLRAYFERYVIILFMLFITAFAVIARIYLINFESGDFVGALNPWYTKIQQEGFYAFKDRFSNYSAPYLYLLYLLTKIGLSSLYSIKSATIIFEIVMSVASFALIKRLTGSKILASIGYSLILLSPTVVLNGAAWGQCDAVFTCFIVISLYYFVCRKYFLSVLYYAISLCFKLQAIFVFPVFLSLSLHGIFPLYYLLILPFLYMFFHIPFVLVGAKISTLFFRTYAGQIGNYKHITLNAPTFFAFCADGNLMIRNSFPYIGVGLTLVGSFLYYIHKSLCRNILLSLAFFSIFVPYVLPRMHERYFFIGDVLTIIYACCRPSRFFVPILVGTASLLSYMPYLLKTHVLPLQVAAIFMGLAVATLGMDLCQAAREEGGQ